MSYDPFSADGGPAFPVNYDENAAGATYRGMSLRDWFAGQALPSVIINDRYDAQRAAEEVYLLADAMLAVRKPK